MPRCPRSGRRRDDAHAGRELGYTYPEAFKVGLAIEELGYGWYEDPLAPDDIYGYTKLKQHLRVPILATEITPGGLWALPPWIARRQLTRSAATS